MDDLPERFQNLMNAMRRNNPKLCELHIDEKELGILLLEQHDDDDDTQQQIIEKEQNLSSSFSCKENNDDTSDHSYDLNYHSNTTSSSNTRRKKIDDLLCCDSGTLHYYMGLLCESMRNNYTIDTVSLDMNMITQSLSSQTTKSLCHSVGRLLKMQSLTLYGKQGGGNYDDENNNNNNNNNYEKSQMIEISWLTSILNTSTNLQSLSIYNANIVAKTKQEEIEFITAMKVLGCTTLTKILCFQVHFQRLYNDNDNQNQNHQGLCIFNDFIQSLPSCVSKLQELRIVNQKLNTFSIHNNNQTTNQMLFSSSSSITKMQQHQYQSPLSLSSSSILLSEGAIKNIFKMENLKILALNGMDLSNNKSTMQTLAESIEQSLAPLESLNLSCNNINDDGCIRLFQSLEQNNKTSSTTTTTSNTGLKELNIASNSFTTKSVHSISNYLRSCDSSSSTGSSTGSSSSKMLKHLNLNSNNITDMGCVFIARSLCSNTCLETLHMSYCNLHDDGIYALSCALLYNRTLRKLYIKYNQGITMNGYQSLLQMLMEHKNHVIDTIMIHNENNNNNMNKHPLMFNKLKFYLNLNKSKIQHKLLLEDNNVSRNVWIKDLLSIQDMMPKKEGSTSTTTTLNKDCSNIVDITSTIYFYVRSKPSLLLCCAC